MLSDNNRLELKDFGYTIVNNVLDRKECNNIISMICRWLDTIHDNTNNMYGIIKDYNIGHSDFLWKVRTNKNVIKVFEELWNEKELLVSFDSMCIMNPPNKGGNIDSISWLHVDQGPKKKGLQCIQGFVNLEETTENDGSMIIIPGSHKYHSGMFEKNGKIFNQDWYKLKDDDIKYIDNLKLKNKRLIIPKGAMVLWDSRTIHCNCYPTNKSTNFRYVVYVCMTPKKWCNNFNLKKRIKAFEENRMTTHWPHIVKLIKKNKNYSKNELKINTLIKKLVGY